jgi:fatty-acyl-CoA synthase
VSDALAAHDLTSDSRWTYAQLEAAVGQFAALLRRREVAAGDRVASLAKNRVELVILHLACARIGALYVPFNWRLASAEIDSLIDDAEPTLLIGDELLPHRAFTDMSLVEFARAASREGVAAADIADMDSPSLILYTSGTSGRPKGVMLSERNIRQTALAFSRCGHVTQRSAVLCDTPMFHVIGLITNVRPALLQGGTILVSDGFITERTLARLGAPSLGVTHYFCVPQMAASLRADPSFDPARLRSLTAIFSGGAPHAADAIRAWCSDGIPIADGFGMSEAGTVSCMPIDVPSIAARAGSAGLPAAGMQAEIRDEMGVSCAVGTPGELYIRGPSITSGYWRQPETTRAAFDAQGWLRTGDIARIDEEGFLWLVDRKKDMFISGGENVYPAEIEAVLAYYPGIAECAVVGVPDARWGEVGHLAVVTRGDVMLDRDAVTHLLATRLARYKIPKYISTIDELPRNGAGKVRKDVLRSVLAQRR